METATVGKVIVSAKIENLFDIEEVFKGRITDDQVPPAGSGRRHGRYRSHDFVPSKTANRSAWAEATSHRACPDGERDGDIRSFQPRSTHHPISLIAPWRLPSFPMIAQPLIGVIPLEILDFVVDPKRLRLIGNPEHGGERMFEMF